VCTDPGEEFQCEGSIVLLAVMRDTPCHESLRSIGDSARHYSTADFMRKHVTRGMGLDIVSSTSSVRPSSPWTGWTLRLCSGPNALCRGSSAAHALWQDLTLIIQLGVQSAVPLPLDSGLIDAPLFHQGEPTLPQLDLVTFSSLRCATFRLCLHSKREGWGA
jgi:hypothetical protein